MEALRKRRANSISIKRFSRYQFKYDEKWKVFILVVLGFSDPMNQFTFLLLSFLEQLAGGSIDPLEKFWCFSPNLSY